MELVLPNSLVARTTMSENNWLACALLSIGQLYSVNVYIGHYQSHLHSLEPSVNSLLSLRPPCDLRTPLPERKLCTQVQGQVALGMAPHIRAYSDDFL